MEAASNPYRRADRYFEVLQATLKEVFLRADAASIVASVATELARSPSDLERLLFFHAEPIAAAEDVTGERPTPEMYATYERILERFHWLKDQ